MTKLEWALKNGCKRPCEYVKQMIIAEVMNNMTVDERFIVANFCPGHYGLSNTAQCYATACEDCWNQEVWG